MPDPRALDDLTEQLPPAAEDLDGPETLDDVQEGEAQAQPASRQTVEQVAPAATPEELDKITSDLIGVIAEMGAETMPLPLRQTYYDAMTGNKFLRRGLIMSGLPTALDELAPSGVGNGGPIRQLHPLVRVGVGLLVLAAGSFMTRRAVLESVQA